MIALLCLSSWCFVFVIVLLLFLMVPLVGLQLVIVISPDYNHLFLGRISVIAITSKLFGSQTVDDNKSLKAIRVFIYMYNVHI